MFCMMCMPSVVTFWLHAKLNGYSENNVCSCLYESLWISISLTYPDRGVTLPAHMIYQIKGEQSHPQMLLIKWPINHFRPLLIHAVTNKLSDISEHTMWTCLCGHVFHSTHLRIAANHSQINYESLICESWQISHKSLANHYESVVN